MRKLLFILTCTISAYTSAQSLDPALIASNFVKATDTETQKLIDDAKPAIVQMVDKVACGAQKNQIQKFTAPTSASGLFATPFVKMFKHDIRAKNGCLIPYRIHGWERETKGFGASKIYTGNFSFQVEYESLQTGDTAVRRYRAIKQPDGIWLFGW